MQEIFTFDDVLIVPKFSDISSRKDVDISVNVDGLPYMSLPILSANMDTVTGPEMARAMQMAGGDAVLHRFCSIEENVKMLQKSIVGGTGGYSLPFVSIGLGDSELDRARALIDAGAKTVVIDVAHGAQKSVVEQVIKLRAIMGEDGGIVVGNFATAESVGEFLDRVDYETIDAIKVGIGPGSACTTRIKTGVGYPQLSAIINIFNVLKNSGIAVIADGGMKTPGDVAKAIGAGAHMVMLGGMLAGTEESLGELYAQCSVHPQGIKIKKLMGDKYAYIGVDGKMWEGITSNTKLMKKYRGSASKESYEAQGKMAIHRTSEGESFMVPYKGLVANILQDIEGGLRSAMTYVGAKNIKEFHEKVEFVRISPSTVKENGSHGKS